MRWLVDTNVISESMRPRPNGTVRDWVEAREQELALSVVTLAELRDGASTLPDNARRRLFDNWISEIVIPRFDGRTFALTLEILTDFMLIGRRLGARGRPQSAPDLLIAATARMYNLTVATRDVRGFANTGITVYNPWTNETVKMEAP
jgi:predicted nucleic acid-binding protein